MFFSVEKTMFTLIPKYKWIASDLENLQVEGYKRTNICLNVFRVFFVVNGCWWYEPTLDHSLKL